mmetsp:Transcript_30490/g.77005  ORF Transcript_30490/g.77005 Transcript_30490/m.77005 type:complete len:185 (-) Transcript_30490:126-680(-)
MLPRIRAMEEESEKGGAPVGADSADMLDSEEDRISIQDTMAALVGRLEQLTTDGDLDAAAALESFRGGWQIASSGDGRVDHHLEQSCFLEDRDDALFGFGSLYAPEPPPMSCEVPECVGPDPRELWLDDDPHHRTMGDVMQGVLGLGVISLAIGFWWFAARLIESGLPPWLRFLSARRKLCSSF